MRAFLTILHRVNLYSPTQCVSRLRDSFKMLCLLAFGIASPKIKSPTLCKKHIILKLFTARLIPISDYCSVFFNRLRKSNFFVDHYIHDLFSFLFAGRDYLA